MTQYFWKRWQSDYLNQLQTRTKWQSKMESPKVGDIALIHEENLPPLQWQTGTIVELHPGEDNLTRVVTLRVGDSLFKRPVTKVCPLPKDETEKINANITRSNIHKQKPMGVLPVITALLMVFTTVCHTIPVNNSKPFEISLFERPPGLFFEHKSDAYVAMSYWNLVANVDLRKFGGMFKHFNERMSVLKATCKNRFDNDNFCNEWVDTLDAKIRDLNEKYGLITSG